MSQRVNSQCVRTADIPAKLVDRRVTCGYRLLQGRTPYDAVSWTWVITSIPHVAIIGAGFYGLSIAAHLRIAGASFRIFGEPMKNGCSRMPEGMHLKSDGLTTSLFDLERRFTLRHYCADMGITYADLGLPAAVEIFSSVGMAFQEQMVHCLDTCSVVKLERPPDCFRLTMNDSGRLETRRVIIATGISNFEYLPRELSHRPRTLCSHHQRPSSPSPRAGARKSTLQCPPMKPSGPPFFWRLNGKGSQ